MSIKAKVEAIIYATEEPVTLSQLMSVLKDAVIAELRAEAERLTLDNSPSVGESASDEALPPDGKAESTPVQVGSELQPDSNDPSAAASADAISSPQEGDAKDESKRVKAYLSQVLDELSSEYARTTHGVEIRQLAGGYRMGTKPEHHDVVVSFAKSMKPPIRLSLPALETLSVIAYKQPVTVPEISEIRGVDSSGVIATLLDRKLITTAGRKQVIGRPILYKTTKEFLLRFGLDSVAELPSIEEFEKLGDRQADLFPAPGVLRSEAAGGEAPSSDATPVDSAARNRNIAGEDPPSPIERSVETGGPAEDR